MIQITMVDLERLVCRVARYKQESAKYRKIVAAAPYEHICMDIKYIYIHGLRTNAYLLAIIDVATRYVLGWSLRLSMKYQDVETV